ncbi:MAG: SMP-30/gluconolactonase/LRE family protein [Deltaproteobacteria bacterium]|nr:SMP-30/gluconolactonase/LRE family protein [Deltaproteobacteria bacterium]
MSVIKEFIYSLIFRNQDISGFHVKPVMDGDFAANNRLDEAIVLKSEVTAPDDLLSGSEGKYYVSSGKEILVFDGPDFTRRGLFAKFEAEVGGLEWSQDGELLACVSGRGVCVLSESGVVSKWLESVGGVKLACPTAVTTAADGTVYVTDGSRRNPTDKWLQDLMTNEKGSGRLISWENDLGNARVVAEGLSWPAGAVVSHDENQVLVTEAWSHKLCAVERQSGERRYLVANYAGYPWRITRGLKGDYWLAFFAVRSQLIDFVLRERDYCDRMMAEVPTEFWVGPALSSKSHYLHPTQYGRIKTLGVQKPWAPARSYGLVARLDADGQAVESFHSRVGGKVHGVTSVRCIDKRIIACSKGDDKLVEVDQST